MIQVHTALLLCELVQAGNVWIEHSRGFILPPVWDPRSLMTGIWWHVGVWSDASIKILRFSEEVEECWVMLHYVPKTVCLYLALQVDPKAWKARGKQNKLTLRNPVIWPSFWGQAKDSQTTHDQGYKRYEGWVESAASSNRVVGKRDASWCTVPRQVVESAATLFRTPRGHGKETCAKPCRCRTSMLTPSILSLVPIGNGDSFRLTFASQIPSPCSRNKQDIQELTQKMLQFRHLEHFSRSAFSRSARSSCGRTSTTGGGTDSSSWVEDLI